MYLLQVEPVLVSVMPTSIGTGGGSLITITGVGFVVGESQATIGNQDCALVSETGSELVCSAPALSAGSHDVEVRVAPFYNYAALTITVASASNPVITSVSPTSGRGGDDITITGDFDPTSRRKKRQGNDVVDSIYIPLFR